MPLGEFTSKMLKLKPKLRKSKIKIDGTGASIATYTLQLAEDKSTVFAGYIDNFVTCTKESDNISPHVVMKNIRQFMEGMKNYLVNSGGHNVRKYISKERKKLADNQILDIDEIFEVVLVKLVVTPLRDHMNKLFIAEYSQNGALQKFAENLEKSRDKTPQYFGASPTILPPSEEIVEEIISELKRMQASDSPLEKLNILLTTVNLLYKEVRFINKSKEESYISADDFLPLLVWVLIQSRMVEFEIETDYIWGLVDPTGKTGEEEYYLTTLYSAVQIIKNYAEREGESKIENPTCEQEMK